MGGEYNGVDFGEISQTFGMQDPIFFRMISFDRVIAIPCNLAIMTCYIKNTYLFGCFNVKRNGEHVYNDEGGYASSQN